MMSPHSPPLACFYLLAAAQVFRSLAMRACTQLTSRQGFSRITRGLDGRLQMVISKSVDPASANRSQS